MDNNQNQNQNHNPNDILISVDPITPQDTTPTATLHSSNPPTSPLVSPPHLRLPSQSDEPREPPILPSVEPDFGVSQPTSGNNVDALSPNSASITNGGAGGNGANMVDYSDRSQGIPRPLSPPHLGIHHAFRAVGGDHSHYRYPQSGNATPSVRSLRLQGHQQSNRPYISSRNNEYHPPMGGHRIVGDGQHDTGKPMVIDYAGLDASVAEASLIENGFRKYNVFMDSPGEPAGDRFESKEEGEGGNNNNKPLERTVSISSSNNLAAGPTSANSGQSEFRRRSARKASFYSERAPRVSVHCGK